MFFKIKHIIDIWMDIPCTAHWEIASNSLATGCRRCSGRTRIVPIFVRSALFQSTASGIAIYGATYWCAISRQRPSNHGQDKGRQIQMKLLGIGAIQTKCTKPNIALWSEWTREIWWKQIFVYYKRLVILRTSEIIGNNYISILVNLFKTCKIKIDIGMDLIW